MISATRFAERVFQYTYTSNPASQCWSQSLKTILLELSYFHRRSGTESRIGATEWWLTPEQQGVVILNAVKNLIRLAKW